MSDFYYLVDYRSFAPGGSNAPSNAPSTPPPVLLLPPPQKHFVNHKFASTFVILILLALGSYAGLLYWQNQIDTQEVPPAFTPRAEETADWKTYTNTQYGFEFKYPAGHELEKFDFINNTYGIEDHSVSFAIEDGKRGMGYDDTIVFGVKVGGGNPESFIKNAYGERYNEWISNGKLQKISLAGRQAIVDNTNTFNGGFYSSYIYGKDDSYFILISQGSNNELLNQILSTFKFTDSANLTASPQISPGLTVTNRTSIQVATANSRRVADVLSAKVSLEIYSDDHTIYPVSNGTTSQQRWSSLCKDVVQSGVLTKCMQDPNQENGFSYDYRTSSDQKSFVIKAVMEPEDAQASKIYNPSAYLQYMNRGIIFGMDCSGPAICVTIM